MNLHDVLSTGPLYEKLRRVGRGLGSGMGKTSTRGQKGHGSRQSFHGKLGFEGGQMPLYRRLPKRGFNNIFRLDFSEVNLGSLQDAIEAKRLDASKPINGKALKAAGLIGRVRDGVRLLGKGELKTKINITVVGATKAAVAAVEKAGGSVTVKAPKKPKVDAEAAKA